MSVWRETLARAVLAALGIPLLCLMGWLGGWYWYAVVAAIVIIGLGEFYSACYAKGFRPPAMIAYGWALALVWAAGKEPRGAAIWMGMLALAAAVTIAVRALLPPRKEYVGSVATAVFGLVYIAGGLAFMELLRGVDVPAGVGRRKRGASRGGWGRCCWCYCRFGPRTPARFLQEDFGAGISWRLS